MRRILFIAAIVSCLLISPGWTMDRFEIVTTEEMHSMVEDREAGKADFLLVNTLDELLYRHQSIPGSINVPWATVEETFYRLGNDKSVPIVLYCKGYR